MIGNPEEILPLRLGSRTVNLSCWKRDAGPDLVLFVHGLGCSRSNWREAWSRPGFRDMSLVAVDLPGFGRSPRLDGFGYTLENHAEVLAAVIDGFASRRISLVAHSMGGSVSLLLPRQILARLDGLYLVEPRLLASSCGIAAEAAAVTMRVFLTEVYPRFRRRIATDSRAAFDLDRADGEAFYRSAVSLIEWARGEALLERFLDAPCRRIFIYGSDNAHLDELSRIRADKLLRVENAGHFVMHDAPDSLYGSLTGLIRH